MKKTFFEYKEEIKKCSQCGLCMAVCPLYLDTKNDCANARGLFAMLKGILKGELQLDETIIKYLVQCDNCKKCKEFCPSGIDIPEIVASARELYKNQM